MLIDKDLCQAPRQEINNWMTAINVLIREYTTANKVKTHKNIFQARPGPESGTELKKKWPSDVYISNISKIIQQQEMTRNPFLKTFLAIFHDLYTQVHMYDLFIDKRSPQVQYYC
jgi:hypothetical protein